MPKNLYCGLDQLAFIQIKHKAHHSKPLDSSKGVLQHLLLSVPVNGYVNQVDDYKQGTVAQPTV